MKATLLLPNKFKTLGWLILLPATALGVFSIITQYDDQLFKMPVFAVVSSPVFGETKYFAFIHTGIVSTLAGMLFIAGALLVGFSKEKMEDEFIANMRLSSLMWAVLLNYTLLFFAFAFVYGTPFLSVMIYNIFTVLIIFIARFNYLLYKNNNAAKYEK